MSDRNQKTYTNDLLTPGMILQSRYRIIRKLGNGGMGAVYEANDLRLDHTVALKQILTNDEAMWKQFEREARLMASLNHPALPRVSDYFTEGNRAFFVMQIVEGSDLAEMIVRQPGPFPRNAVIAWADQLLDALVYLHSHERQIIHRDIKPHNLKVTASGQIALLDFGLAKSQTSTRTDAATKSVFGYTPRYAPLEQIQDLGTGPQSDIYALGATLYHLLTGVKPPDALTRAAALISARPNPLKSAYEINPAVGEELSAILSCAMAQNPDERYASAGDFREALRWVGRVEQNESTQLDEQIDATVLATPESEIDVSVYKMAPKKMFGSRVLGACFIILLTSFCVFCRYYPWNMPGPASNSADPAISTVDAKATALPMLDQTATPKQHHRKYKR